MPFRPNPAHTLELERRKNIVQERYLQGQSLRKIAASLELTPGNVNTILTKLRAEWREQRKEQAAAMLPEQLAKLDMLESQYQAAFERSCQPRKVSGAKTKKGGTGRQTAGQSGAQSGQVMNQDRQETFLREEQRDGNPKFLDGVQRCIELRCRLAGLLSADRSGGAGEDDGPIGMIEIAVRQDGDGGSTTAVRIGGKTLERDSKKAASVEIIDASANPADDKGNILPDILPARPEVAADPDLPGEDEERGKVDPGRIDLPPEPPNE